MLGETFPTSTSFHLLNMVLLFVHLPFVTFVVQGATSYLCVCSIYVLPVAALAAKEPSCKPAFSPFSFFYAEYFDYCEYFDIEADGFL